MARQHEVRLRLTAQGKEELIDTLRGMGKEGQRAAQQIERASRPAGRGIKAIDRAAKDARGSLNSFANRLPVIGPSLASMGPAGLAAAAGVAAVGVALTAAIRVSREAVREFDRIAKTSRDLGLSSDLYQAIGLAADEASIPIEKVNQGLIAFTRNSARAATGRGEMVETLRATHPALLEEIAALESADDRLERYRQALVEAETQQERNLLANAAFGESGFAIARMLAEQGESMDQLTRRAKDMGIVVEQSVLARAEEMETQLSIASRVIDLNLKQAFIDLAPILVSTSETLGTMAQGVRALTDEFRELENRSTAVLRAELSELGDELHEQTMRRIAYVERYSDQASETLLGQFSLTREAGQMLRDGEVRLDHSLKIMDDRIAGLERRRDELRGILDGREDPPETETDDGGGQDLQRMAELQRIVAQARAQAQTSAEALAAELEALREARQAGLIATDEELASLEAAARARRAETSQVRERSGLERQAARLRAELGDFTALLALEVAELTEQVQAGLLTREQADLALERTRASLEQNSEATREAAQIIASIATPLEVYSDRLALLDGLLQAQLLTEAQHARAVDQAREAYEQADPILSRVAQLRREIYQGARGLAIEEAALNALVEEGLLTRDEATQRLAEYQRQLDRSGSAIQDLRMDTELLDRALSGQLSSWEQVGRVAIDVIRQIILEQSKLTESTQGFGGFLGRIFQGVFGGGNTMSDATGGPESHVGTGVVSRSSMASRYRAYRPLAADEHMVKVRDDQRILTQTDNRTMLAKLDQALMQNAAPAAITQAASFSVQVHNHGAPERVEMRQTRNGSGGVDVEITLRDTVAGQIGRGDYDRELGDRYGLRRRMEAR